MSEPYINEEHNITIDISPRQSGKTERLIDKAIRYVMEDDSHLSVIVCYNHAIGMSTRNKVNIKLGDDGRRHRNMFNIISYQSLGRDVDRNLRNLTNNYNVKLFFDEFELMNNIPLIPNSYYISSSYESWGQSNTHRFMLELNDSHVDSVNALMTNYVDNHTRFIIERQNDIPLNRVINNHGDIVEVPAREWSLHINPPDQPEMSDEESYLYRLGI